MEAKSLRKSLRLWLEEFTRLQTALEKLNTEENQALLLQYPIIDKSWQHPQSHLMLRAFELLESTRKTMVKIVGALPAERKTKVVKFVEPKSSKKEKSLSEQAKPSKKKPKETRTGQKTRKARKGAGEDGRQAGSSGSPPKQPGGSVQPKVRRPRSDKGKKRK